MTDHPLTETRAESLWDTHCGYRFTLGTLAAMRAAYDAGREDALTPLDPLAFLTPGTVIRDVTLLGDGAVGDAFIFDDDNVRRVATARDLSFLSWITAFTTDDRTTRYTGDGDTWTAETLDGDA